MKDPRRHYSDLRRKQLFDSFESLNLLLLNLGIKSSIHLWDIPDFVDGWLDNE